MRESAELAYADTVKRDEAALNALIAGIRNTRLHEIQQIKPSDIN